MNWAYLASCDNVVQLMHNMVLDATDFIVTIAQYISLTCD